MYDELINFKNNYCKKLNIRTNISLNNSIVNISEWNNVISNDNFNLIEKKRKYLNLDYNYQILPSKNYKFKYIDIEYFNTVILINNDIQFFTLYTYLNNVKSSNIKVYLKFDKNLHSLSNILYKSYIYDSQTKLNNLFFTDKLIQNIPLKKINIDIIYYFDDKYNINKIYNCFYNDKNFNKHLKIKLSEYDYQKFNSESIIWFLDRIYMKKLHLYSSEYIILCDKNLDIIEHNNSYIFINQELKDYLQLYYNWYNKSDNFNISIQLFIVSIFSFYFYNINVYPTIYFNNYFKYKFDKTHSIYNNNTFCGINVSNINSFNSFNLFLETVTTIKADINLNNECRKSECTKLCLITNQQINKFKINNILVTSLNKKLEYCAKNIIEIKTKYPFNEIYIFDTLNNFNKYENCLSKLADCSYKYNYQNSFFIKIINNYNNKELQNNNLKNYIFDYDLLNLKDKLLYDYTEYKKEILRIIDKYHSDSIIVTYYIENENIIKKFIEHYKNDYAICIIFTECQDLIYYNLPYVLSLRFFDELNVFKFKFKYIHPNYLYSKIGNYIYHVEYFDINKINDENVSKSNKKIIESELALYNYQKSNSYQRLVILCYKISIFKYIKLNNLFEYDSFTPLS